MEVIRGENRILPVILLDIDGVLNPFLSFNLEEEGFSTFSVGWATWSLNAQKHAPWLKNLLNISNIVWCSSWADDSNKICDIFNLPHFQYITFTPALEPLQEGESWKMQEIDHRYRKTSEKLVWIDDELGEDVVNWANQRGKETTLLIHCNPSEGLTKLQYEEILDFLADNNQ